MCINEQQLKQLIRVPDKLDICPHCGDKYEYVGLGQYKCIGCGNINYDAYGRVRNYIDNNGTCSPSELMKKANVSRADIKALIDRGSLEIIAGKIR